MGRLLDVSTVVLVALFMGFAGVDKLLHWEGFVRAVNTYKIFPVPIGDALGPIVIALELGICCGLLVKRWRGRAALLCAVLVSLFTVLLLSNRFLGGRGLCGCWFSVNLGGDVEHVALNLLVIFLSGFIWYEERGRGRLAAMEQ